MNILELVEKLIMRKTIMETSSFNGSGKVNFCIHSLCAFRRMDVDDILVRCQSCGTVLLGYSLESDSMLLCLREQSRTKENR